jgi:hypothetical protein
MSALLQELRTLGVEVSAADSKLTLDAAPGVLTDDLLGRAREAKADILAALAAESLPPTCECGRSPSPLPSRGGMCEPCWYADLIASIPTGAPSRTVFYEMGDDERAVLGLAPAHDQSRHIPLESDHASAGEQQGGSTMPTQAPAGGKPADYWPRTPEEEREFDRETCSVCSVVPAEWWSPGEKRRYCIEHSPGDSTLE